MTVNFTDGFDPTTLEYPEEVIELDTPRQLLPDPSALGRRLGAMAGTLNPNGLSLAERGAVFTKALLLSEFGAALIASLCFALSGRDALQAWVVFALCTLGLLRFTYPIFSKMQQAEMELSAMRELDTYTRLERTDSARRFLQGLSPKKLMALCATNTDRYRGGMLRDAGNLCPELMPMIAGRLHGREELRKNAQLIRNIMRTLHEAVVARRIVVIESLLPLLDSRILAARYTVRVHGPARTLFGVSVDGAAALDYYSVISFQIVNTIARSLTPTQRARDIINQATGETALERLRRVVRAWRNEPLRMIYLRQRQRDELAVTDEILSARPSGKWTKVARA